jgi:hypothetical protein
MMKKTYKEMKEMFRSRFIELKFPEPICKGKEFCLICGDKMLSDKSDCKNDKKHKLMMFSTFQIST